MLKSFGSSFAFAGIRGAFTTFERADEPEDAAVPEGLIGLAGAESGPTAYLAPSALCVASSALEKRQPIRPLGTIETLECRPRRKRGPSGRRAAEEGPRRATENRAIRETRDAARQ